MCSPCAKNKTRPFLEVARWRRDEQVIDGQSAYDYGPAGATWRSYGLEGQATMVDQWFGGNRRQTAQKLGTGIAMDKNSPYFQYIDNNVRAGIPG